MKKILFFIFVTLISRFAYATVSQPDFDAVLDNIGSMYEKQISDGGGRMVIRRQYTYPEYVGAAQRWRDGSWTVEIWGGFPHDPAMSAESLAMVVCHEFAHHFGGEPLNVNSGEPWASVEGQSDYFAAGTCMPEYLKRFGNTEAEQPAMPEIAKLCEGSNDSHCPTILRAAYEFAVVISQQQKNPAVSFNTPDTTVVEKTEVYHPHAQCRLDTMVAGYFKHPRPACWFKAD